MTLVGPPGVGKTRLGLEVAMRLEPLFKDGARFVPLAAVSDPELVATTIATELELAVTGMQAPQTRLIQGLRHQQLLLVLDNFEQLIASAPLLAAVLEACPGLHLLVTSRERLHLRAEQRYPVPPLDLEFAIALFVQRVQAVEPAFEPTAATTASVSQICQRLDCLPLAIELLAARSDLFSPQTMLTHLQDRGLDLLTDGAQDAPAHQRTLRKAIGYSYDLLAERERQLLRILGIFSGGFDLAAMTHFGFGAELLQGLLNKSLVQSAPRPASIRSNGEAERRFVLLETLREYAYEQLTVNQEADWVQRQHAAYYMQVVEQIEPKLCDAQVANWLDYLETEHNNVRNALTWALATGDKTTALRLCGALRFFWAWHGHVREAKHWLEKALAISADAPLTVWAKALSAAGQMEHMLGNHRQAQTLVEQSLALYQTANDRQNSAEMSLQLGGILRMQHSYAQAKRCYEQSFQLFQVLENQSRLAGVHLGLGSLAMNQGDYPQARVHYEQALMGYRASGDKLGTTELLPRLAMLLFERGEEQRALLYCEELLALAQELGDQERVADALNQLGSIALYQGEFDRATSYITQSLALAQELNYPPLLVRSWIHQGNLAFAQGDVARANQSYCQSLQLAHQLMELVEIASGLASLAGVAYAQGDAERAIRLLGAAESTRNVSGVRLPASEQLHYQELIATARTQLGETTYASVYAEGHAMTLDQAVAFGLAQPTG